MGSFGFQWNRFEKTQIGLAANESRFFDETRWPRDLRGQVVVEAEIFFAHLDQNRSQQLFGDQNFVFSGELKRVLDKVRRQG